jgi:hypothetical protein
MDSERLYMVANHTLATTAAPVKQPTGTAIRTMLQLASLSTNGFYIVEWGCSFDGSAAATPIQVELFGTTVAATMSTALASTDVSRITSPASDETIPLQYGTTTSGYATAAVTEGTVANYRLLDLQLVAPTSQFVHQWPLSREPEILKSQFVRVRVTASASVNMYTYIIFGDS